MMNRDKSYQRLNGTMAEGKSVSIKITGSLSKGTDDINNEVHLLCINLSTLPRYVQLLTCITAIFFFYLIYGYFQVRLHY